jgi:hypothetical protein
MLIRYEVDGALVLGLDTAVDSQWWTDELRTIVVFLHSLE